MGLGSVAGIHCFDGYSTQPEQSYPVYSARLDVPVAKLIELYGYE